MERNQWNLNKAVDWFHGHRNDDDLPSDLRRALKTKEELKEEEEGRKILDFKYLFLIISFIKVYDRS